MYSPINFDLWPVFNEVHEADRRKIVLAHIFGEDGRSALFITDYDSVYAVGANDLGRLGIGDIEFASTPVEIPFLKGRQVKCFASGSAHTLALTEVGELYSWGNNTLGRLGNGTILDSSTPVRVFLPHRVLVKSVCCGDRYCLALSYDNRVLHWGDVQFSSCQGQNIPCEISFPFESIICEIACGCFHAAVLTTSGQVYTWGINSLGQLGRKADSIDVIPALVERPPNSGPALAIGCGLTSTFILNRKNKLESYGVFKDQEFNNELNSPPIDEFAITNMGCLLCARSDDRYFIHDEESFFDKKTLKPIDIHTMQNAFAKRATPLFLKANPSDMALEVVEPIQGSTRDIEKMLFDKKEFSDLVIKLSDGLVYVHKLILTTFCEHFKSMLLGSWGTETKNEMDMQSYNARAYRAFLKFVYSGTLEPLQGPELIDLYSIAQSYFESELRAMTVTMFRKRLQPENTASLYALACKGVCEELIDICHEFASGHVDEVISSEGFDNLSPDLCKTLVKEATKRKKKNI